MLTLGRLDPVKGHLDRLEVEPGWPSQEHLALGRMRQPAR